MAMHPVPRMPPPRPPRSKGNGCLISGAVLGGLFVLLLLFGGCTAALMAGPGSVPGPPSATPTSSEVPVGDTPTAGTPSDTADPTATATPTATRPSPARHRRHTARPKRPRPRPTPARTKARRPHHHVTHPPKPRPTHAPTHAHPLTVRPGAFCAHGDAGHIGVSAAGRTYVCRTDSGGRLRWRRP